MVRRSVSRNRSPSRSPSRSRSSSPAQYREGKINSTKRQSKSPRMTKRMSGVKRRSPKVKRSSTGRKRSPNVYIKFAIAYRKSHPSVNKLPVPQQGKVIGAAYRKQKGTKRRSPAKRMSGIKRRSMRK